MSAVTERKPPKAKTCSKVKGGCGQKFVPMRSMQSACGVSCAQAMAQRKREKESARKEQEGRRQTRAKLLTLKPLSYWRNRAQAAVNRFVRLRDAEQPCISCGATTAVQWHAGHLLSRGARPELALEPRNIYKQCSQCNDHMSGNIINYRASLIRLKGREEVDWLEGPHQAKHYSAEDFRAIEAEYKAKANRLERNQNDE